MFALFAATILAFTLPDVLGGGNFLVDSLAKARYGFGFLAALLLAKFLFTLISYGCGVPGGFFLPLLVIGALIGSLEGELLISAGILSALYLPNIIIIAMVAFFAASIRAPITGTLLILEMTGDFHHLTALALASAVAYVTAELLKGQPIYDSLLKNPCPMVLRPFPTKKEIFWKFPWAAVPSSKTGQWRKSPVCLTRYSSISKGRGQI